MALGLAAVVISKCLKSARTRVSLHKRDGERNPISAKANSKPAPANYSSFFTNHGVVHPPEFHALIAFCLTSRHLLIKSPGRLETFGECASIEGPYSRIRPSASRRLLTGGRL